MKTIYGKHTMLRRKILAALTIFMASPLMAYTLTPSADRTHFVVGGVPDTNTATCAVSECLTFLGELGDFGSFPVRDINTGAYVTLYGATTTGTMRSLSSSVYASHVGRRFAPHRPMTICIVRKLGDSVGASFQYPSCADITPAPMCNLELPSTDYALNSVNQSEFTGVGSSAGTIASNTANVVCVVSQNATVRITGTNSELGNTALATTGGAKGVGVKLTLNGSPVVLGDTVAMGALPVGTTPLNITAQYVQTLPLIEAGVANATATLTVTFS